MHIKNRLSRVIVTSFLLTQFIAAIGTGFAIQQNWQVRLEASKNSLVRNAGIGNLLLETALLSASKKLDATQTTIEQAFKHGTLSHAEMQLILAASEREFADHHTSKDLGLVFFVDPQGLVYARSDVRLTRPIDMSDRFYFTELRDHPEKVRTVGPLVMSRTTRQWVFHMSVPIHDAKGHFAGVLVQQLLVADIASALDKYTETHSFDHMLTHYPGSAVSFVYPPPTDPQAHARLADEIKHLISPDTPSEGTSTWMEAKESSAKSAKVLIGIAASPTFGLITYTALPIQQVVDAFVRENGLFFVYALCGFMFSGAVFFYLYRVSQRLALAQASSLHDPLTGLHNRRAMDEQLPLVLRDSMREQQPISILFVDIDHFRLFNERYGHESGDVALQAVAQALASVCQRPLDFVCRWGGEEFVALLPDTDDGAAQKIAHDMLHAIRGMKLAIPHHRPPRLTVSIGHLSTTLCAAGLDADWVGAADQAMLRAKHLGRNQSIRATRSDFHMNTRMTCTPQHHEPI